MSARADQAWNTGAGSASSGRGNSSTSAARRRISCRLNLTPACQAGSIGQPERLRGRRDHRIGRRRRCCGADGFRLASLGGFWRERLRLAVSSRLTALGQKFLGEMARHLCSARAETAQRRHCRSCTDRCRAGNGRRSGRHSDRDRSGCAVRRTAATARCHSHRAAAPRQPAPGYRDAADVRTLRRPDRIPRSCRDTSPARGRRAAAPRDKSCDTNR